MKVTQAGFGTAGMIFIVFILAISGFAYYRVQNADEEIAQSKQITNYDECVAAGNPVMESYPEQCAANGITFTNTVPKLEEGSQLDPNMISQASFNSVDEALQAAILNKYKEVAPGCLENGTFSNDVMQDKLIWRYIPEQYAQVSIGCDSGSLGIFAYQDSQWKFLESTADEYTCEVLETNKVPYQILTGYIDQKPNCRLPDATSRPVNY
jgi:hypothetical protein